MVKVRVALPVPAELVALRVTLNVPEVCGMPDIRPVVAFNVRPAGNPEALKVVGLFDAAIP